jgi:hypothetical protein
MISSIALSCLILAPLASVASQSTDKRITVGYVEKVSLPAVDIKLKAKLDTGAKTSSIHANILEVTEKDKDKKKDKGFVVFTIETSDGSSKTIKKPIKRWVRIKKKESEGFIRRPVVNMTVCIAGQLVKDEEINLANRENFNYDLLIGRNMLEHGQLVIDVSKVFTTEPNCSVKSEAKDSSDDA